MARRTHSNTVYHRDLVPTDQLGTGSASSATFLRGDQTWGTPAGGSSSFGSNSNSVGSANAPGASSSNAHADHVHQGVHRLTSNGSNGLFEDVNVAAGSGIAVTQSGQTVTISSTGSAGGGGSGTLTTIEEVDGSPTSSTVTKLVLPNGTLSYVGTVATYTPTSSGSGVSGKLPVQQKLNKSDTTNSLVITLDATPTNGNRLIVCSSNSGTGTITGISQTNVSWSSLVVSGASAPRQEIWVGVVSASAGTTVTISYSASNFNGASVSEWNGITGTLAQSAVRNGISHGSWDATDAILPTHANALVLAVQSQSSGAGTTHPLTGVVPFDGFTANSPSTISGYTQSGYAFPGTVPVRAWSNTGGSGTTSSIIAEVT
jgi:hypothetical protein